MKHQTQSLLKQQKLKAQIFISIFLKKNDKFQKFNFQSIEGKRFWKYYSYCFFLKIFTAERSISEVFFFQIVQSYWFPIIATLEIIPNYQTG